jgi:hypothetical protein
MRFRCSSIGRLMTEPKTKADGPLSVGARTYIRELAAQEIFGVDFLVTSKAMEKGIEVEEEAIQLLNRVRGLSLTKNEERRHNDFITGECDLFDGARKRGHDVKSSWSISTFPILLQDCKDSLYEWQMRGYMALWDADEWEVNYCLVDTPDRLISYEPMELHFVSGIPEHMRVTTWTVQRDLEKEAAIFEKVKHAREYFNEVIQEFDRTHQQEKKQ